MIPRKKLVSLPIRLRNQKWDRIKGVGRGWDFRQDFRIEKPGHAAFAAGMFAKSSARFVPVEAAMSPWC
jgi:hypothetical protein